MRIASLILVAALAVVAGCGESRMLECDSGPYLTAVRAPRVQAPEGLDNLDPLREVPLPAASPQEPRADDGPCLEQPPQIIQIR